MKKVLTKIKEYLFPYYSIIKNDNKIVIIDEKENKRFLHKYEMKKIKGLRLSIEGRNNILTIKKPYNFQNVSVLCRGENNSITMNSTNLAYKNLEILFSGSWNNRRICIGRNCSFFGPCRLTLTDNNSYINIGDDCIFSHDVYIYTNDNHTILDKNTKEILNKGYGVEIGNHNWIGHRVSILKNVKLADNVIVGAGAVVSRTFDRNNIAIAGNPAKILKENVIWTIKGFDSYTKSLSRDKK